MAIASQVVSPLTVHEAVGLLAEGGPWRPMAGGTDLLVLINGEFIPPPERVIDLWRIEELRTISLTDDRLLIGSLVTYTELRADPLIAELMPVAAEVAATIGAAQIQNRGTVGGNIGNASPAGDTLPLWLAANADILVGSARGQRRVPASEYFVGYRQTALAGDELILGVEVPLVPRRQYRFRKVGTRRAQAISKVVMVVSWAAEPDGRWSAARVALGSVAPTPVRARSVEVVLDGSLPTSSVADAAVAALRTEIQPIDDVRSTAEYRREVAARILHRILRDEGGW